MSQGVMRGGECFKEAEEVIVMVWTEKVARVTGKLEAVANKIVVLMMRVKVGRVEAR